MIHYYLIYIKLLSIIIINKCARIVHSSLHCPYNSVYDDITFTLTQQTLMLVDGTYMGQ